MRVRLLAEPAVGPRIAPVTHTEGAAAFTEAVEDIGHVLRVRRDTTDAAGWLRAGEIAGRAWRHLPAATVDARGMEAGAAAMFASGVWLGAWHHDLRSKPAADRARLDVLDIACDDPALATIWPRQAASVEGCCFARALVAEPANTLHPGRFPERLEPLRQAGIGVDVLRGEALRGFGGLLAVGAGSVHPPCLIVLRWPGAEAAPPLAFVGKGITFDTGGVCVKPADRMWEMRADMAGAAACAGAMLAIARRQTPTACMAVLAVAENALGGGAFRPGDVLRSRSGRTVEVVDTDAEGRLALMDALSFTMAQQPRAIVDLATLTGSAVVALGHERAALFSRDEALAAAVARAGEAVGERVWRLPVGESHRRALDSDIADLRHCVPGSGQPDACQAAAFLGEFVGAVPWAHLDIAGMELRAEDGDDPGGPTGFGARLLHRLAEDPGALG